MSYKNCPCGKQPNFGIAGGKPTHCRVCKSDDMVNEYPEKQITLEYLYYKKIFLESRQV